MQHFYAAMQMRGWVPEDILRRGITVNPGVLEFPQLIETEYDGNRLTVLYSSHVIATPKGRIWPGQYIVTLHAWGRDTLPTTQMLRLTVRNDAKDPVTIQTILLLGRQRFIQRECSSRQGMGRPDWRAETDCHAAGRSDWL